MKGLENVSFDECYTMAYRATIYDLDIPFLHITHLLANKKAVNRLKDQVDVIELEKIRQLRTDNEQNTK